MPKNAAFVTGNTLSLAAGPVDSCTDAGADGAGTARVGPGMVVCGTADGRENSGPRVTAGVAGPDFSGAEGVGADNPGAQVGTGAGTRSVRWGGTACTCSAANHDASVRSGFGNEAIGKAVRDGPELEESSAAFGIGDGNADVRGGWQSVWASTFEDIRGFGRGFGRGFRGGASLRLGSRGTNSAGRSSELYDLGKILPEAANDFFAISREAVGRAVRAVVAGVGFVKVVGERVAVTCFLVDRAGVFSAFVEGTRSASNDASATSNTLWPPNGSVSTDGLIFCPTSASLEAAQRRCELSWYLYFTASFASSTFSASSAFSTLPVGSASFHLLSRAESTAS